MNTPQPPRWSKALLRWLHPENTIEEVEGDLDELYAYSVQRVGKTRLLCVTYSMSQPFCRHLSAGVSKKQNMNNHFLLALIC
ncbi:hypothetical protein DYBT9275_02411 [Dyadobacter sp. CECT 9275]|uniref:Uncharacterized protein n=1 Tax=Dyadobacter helix TaxID=2822344 RepID=A0A916JC52_9BACT|nr:permease prefix domain 2-containing transporter [Dyadobacter sp. CECT 9275]CAG5000188.1 hypothetical protein DYBT9275_02411 [Dyadobacter sp. CECT 9275]